MRPLLITLTALLALPALAACAVPASNPGAQTVEPFALSLFGGGAARAQDLRGRVVVVNFFASWCVPCREESPDLQRTWQTYRARGVTFLGVDMKDDDPTLAQAFVAELKLDYPSGQDSTGAIADSFKVVGLPNTFILGKDGRIAHRFVGPVKQDRLASLLDQALAGE